MNWLILAIGIALVFLQGVFAYLDGFLTQSQMRNRYNTNTAHGYSFMEHGGMWADVFILSPVIALIVGKYDLGYLTLRGCSLLVVCVVTGAMLGRYFQRVSMQIPEAHAHWGKTTTAGWIHGVYAITAMWIILLFYFSPAKVRLSKEDLCTVSLFLTPFFFVGAAKWNERWFMNLPNDKGAMFQSLAGPITVWLVAMVRMKWW